MPTGISLASALDFPAIRLRLDFGLECLLVDLLDRITHDPNVMGGRPCIRGLRVTVGTLLGLLAAGRPESEILEAYPYLERADVHAALAYAAWRTQETELSLP